MGQRRVSKANLTASATVIDAKELADTPVPNIMNLLQGRVAGMDIQMNNGLPEASGTYNIRGVSDISLVGNNDSGGILLLPLHFLWWTVFRRQM